MSRLAPLTLVAAVAAAVAGVGVPPAAGGSATADSTVAASSTAGANPPIVCVPAGSTSTSYCVRWRAQDRWSGTAAVDTSSLDLGAIQPGVTAYLAWLRTGSIDLALYPGSEGPGATSLPRGPEEVPATGVGRLLATFNSGFYEEDSAAGFYTNRTLYFPMIDGLATLVRYRSGRVDIVDWRSGPRPSTDILMARQNLAMLVTGGRANPAVADGGIWGLTLHGAPAVWRTALGVLADGDLVYVAAPDQTASSLARIMVVVGARRAMQLDINPEWPIFVTYGAPGGRDPALAVPNPNQVANRFLSPSTKDFFAVFRPLHPGEAQPW